MLNTRFGLIGDFFQCVQAQTPSSGRPSKSSACATRARNPRNYFHHLPVVTCVCYFDHQLRLLP